MAKTDNLSDFLTDVANSIRTKKGTTGTINAQNFSSEIASIETGSNPYVAANTTEMAQYLTSKYDGAIVRYTGTTGTYTQNMLYKVKAVSANEWAFDELLTPVGSTTKTENGTYNVKEYAEVIVNVPTGITPTGSIDITSNGTVDVTNYASANVNVANQNPYTAANATEMAQYLASKYYGAVVKYTGTTGTYTNGRLYKVIQVTSNEYAFEELITPVGSTTKTANGTYDVKEYAEVVVNVPSGGEDKLKKLLDATKSCYYLFSNYGGTSVDDLIQPNDTENVTNMSFMFNGCTNLTTIPQLNTGNVTDMNHMFEGCSNLTSIPLLDTSNVTGTGVLGMFKGCSNLTTIPQLNISNVTKTSSMFEGCTSLTTIPLLDTSNATSIGSMFRDCSNLTSIPQLNTSNITTTAYTFSYCTSLTTIPLLDTSKVKNMSATFQGCTNLTTVPALDASNVTNKDNMNTMFSGCTNLKSILMTNIGADLNISASTKFEREDLLVILNNLKTVTEARTLTMGATNLAKLTDEDKAIATNKGWTLA